MTPASSHHVASSALNVARSTGARTPRGTIGSSASGRYGQRWAGRIGTSSGRGARVLPGGGNGNGQWLALFGAISWDSGTPFTLAMLSPRRRQPGANRVEDSLEHGDLLLVRR